MGEDGSAKESACPVQVRDVFEDMLALGLSPSIVTYNTLLSSFASLGAWGEALDTLRRVLAAQLDGVAPNTATCKSAGPSHGMHTGV